MITLFINGLEFYAYHGVPPEERVVGHRYIVDIDLEVDSQAGFSDNVEDTVDYAEVARLIEQAATGSQVKTLERLAQLLADRLLESFPRVASVHMKLAKRIPPAPIIAETAGIVLTQHRSLA